jgi:hypothetical protein
VAPRTYPGKGARRLPAIHSRYRGRVRLMRAENCWCREGWSATARSRHSLAWTDPGRRPLSVFSYSVAADMSRRTSKWAADQMARTDVRGYAIWNPGDSSSGG